MRVPLMYHKSLSQPLIILKIVYQQVGNLSYQPFLHPESRAVVCNYYRSKSVSLFSAHQPIKFFLLCSFLQSEDPLHFYHENEK